MLKESWDAKIKRAEQLAAKNEAARELLAFYGELLRAQKEVYESLRRRKDRLPTGLLEADLNVLGAAWQPFLDSIEKHAPPALAEEARALRQADESEIRLMLLGYWHAPSDIEFFPKSFLQPYARWLFETGARPLDREFERAENLCPFCGGQPQAGVLYAKEPNAESGSCDLICALCLSNWSFRRVTCARCGEQRPSKIGYFHSSEFPHIRVEACDTCHHYIKSVDLTRLGLAVPLVDEVAAAALDLWARERGYTKIELNLVGL